MLRLSHEDEVGNMVDQRFDGVARTLGWRGLFGRMDIRPSPETPTKGRRFVGTPVGVEKVSSEDYSMAASSLARWGGAAAVLGGSSTTFVGGLLPPLRPRNDED
jgi:hypothetical protein